MISHKSGWATDLEKGLESFGTKFGFEKSNKKENYGKRFPVWGGELSTHFSKVLPLFSVFHCMNVFPHTISQNEDGQITFKQASNIRKRLSMFHHAIVLVHVLGLTQSRFFHVNLQIKIMYQILSFAYLGYNASFYYNMNWSGLEIQTLLEKLRDVETELERTSGNVESFKNPQKWVRALMLLYGLSAVAFTCVTRLDIQDVWEDPGNLLVSNAGSAVREVNYLFKLGLEYNSTIAPMEVNAAISFVFAYFSIFYDLCWRFGFLMNFLWAFSFIDIFDRFYKNLEQRSSTKDTLNDIRMYNRICFLIDDYNQIFSTSIAFAVFSGSVHLSIFISSIFAQSMDLGGGIVKFVGFSSFWLQLLAAAQVHSWGQLMGRVLKSRYQDEVNWKASCATTETMQGVQMVFQEINSGNVGIRGSGFFTITYSFIGSVMSLIATYTVVAIQMRET